MSLLDDLHRIENFPTSHGAAAGNVLELLGKLIAFVEHGDELLQAAERDREARAAGEPATHVDRLVSGIPEDETEPSAPTAAAPSAAVDPSPLPGETDQQRVDRLRQELANAEAQLGHPTTTVEPVATDPAAPVADVVPGVDQPPASPTVPPSTPAPGA